MYILKNEEDKIMACANDCKAIQDAKTILSLPNGIIEEYDGEIISNNCKFYKKDEWEAYKTTEEYKYQKSKQDAENEITTLKEHLQKEDYKIIKAMEATIKEEPLPYNMEELLTERENKRARINELEHLFLINN